MGSRIDVLELVGRVLLAALFLVSGVNKILGYDGVGRYMASAGMPMPEILLPLAILLEIGAGVALVVGFRTRWAALGLIVYTLIASYYFHNFWTFEGQEAVMQRNQFLKNMAVVGGLLIVTSVGPGRFGLDRQRR